MKAHFVDTKGPILSTGFLASIKIECDTNSFHEGALMWVLSHYSGETQSTTLSTRLCAVDKFSSILPSARNNENQLRKLHLSHRKVVSYFLNKFAIDKDIAELYASILHSIHQSKMTT